VSPACSRAQFDAELVAALPRLRRLARSLGCGRADAEDLVQQTVLTALAEWQACPSIDGFGDWIGSVEREAFSAETRRVRERERLRDALAIAAAGAPVLIHGTTPAEALAAVLTLPAAMMRAVLFALLDGRRYWEIAMLERTATGTIKSRVSRSRAVVRSLLAPDDGPAVVSPLGAVGTSRKKS
jgi:RNA polymerase sigma-70 factor (ECF subfamily)